MKWIRKRNVNKVSSGQPEVAGGFTILQPHNYILRLGRIRVIIVHEPLRERAIRIICSYPLLVFCFFIFTNLNSITPPRECDGNFWLKERCREHPSIPRQCLSNIDIPHSNAGPSKGRKDQRHIQCEQTIAATKREPF